MKKLAIAAALLCASAAQAAPLFSDNFNTDPYSLNTPSFAGGWSATSGTVDVIGVGTPYDLVGGADGHYIDLDGSTSQAALFANSVTLTAGQTYTLTFDLAGNHRGYSTDSVSVNFGSSSQVITRDSGDAFTTYMLSYTATSTGLASFSFHNAGGDNVGALLDNVSVTAAVPEPETYAMLVAGLGLLGFMARRRRQG
ncbi:PEP-CTERM sorting domain-containing protein [Duganella sp. FT80W]|uniref:PEP-CTERM sorting domain-containing protein n=1 Tax=Duganella guangzhouensis TaxID=2666084 RepID=A0A6I2L2B0_9BURK|nr:PEP-CTERM sorting domain-containing protein [Duganella guangzhouensis]MRW91942.1 PEP-CTERM sorting domain-containing protein [Duganella guangzhouensis]